MSNLTTILTGCSTVIACSLAGCTGGSTSKGPEASSSAAIADDQVGHDHAGHADHGHASAGPHHGELIELGNDEYHAELLHDARAGAITVYILDQTAQEPVPIEAREITVNTRQDGQPKQFQLTASPDEGDPSDKSSRFVANDPELGDHLEQHGASPQLVLTINGKSYRGAIPHNHDHTREGHDHAH